MLKVAAVPVSHVYVRQLAQPDDPDFVARLGGTVAKHCCAHGEHGEHGAARARMSREVAV